MTPYVPAPGDGSSGPGGSGPGTGVPVAPNATNEANVQNMWGRKLCGRLGTGTTRP